MASGAPLAATTTCSAAVVWLPDLGHGQQIGAQAVRMQERPLRAMRVIGSGQMLPTEIVERLLHRIERDPSRSRAH